MAGTTDMKAHVTELKASGAVVSLPGGERAWLPGYEMYSDFRPFEDFRERGKGLVGKDIDVVAFQDPIKNRGKLVSHIRATSDPWKSVSSWSEDDVKIMEVVSKTKVRVMGILSSGIRAEVLIEPVLEVLESPSWQHFGTPLVGDEIAGFFHKDEVDEQNRIVTLDYAGFVQSSISTKDLLSLCGQEVTEHLAIADYRSAADIESRHELGNIRALRGIDSILVVDDDAIFLHSLEEFLSSRVNKVIACETYDDAEKALEKHGDDLDLAIIDIHIPRQRLGSGLIQARDHLGLNLARLIRTQYSGCSVVLITGEEIDAQHEKITKSEDLEVSGLFAKPFGIRELDLALAAANWPPRKLRTLLPGGESPDSVQLKEASSLDEIQDVLDSLRTDIGAQGVILFSIHPVAYSVSIQASSDPYGRFSRIKRKLHLSPIRDAAIDGEEIFSCDASSKNEFPKHRWLQRAYGYKSCIGINVRLSRASQEAYAVFAFHQQPERFRYGEHVARVRIAAREIGHIYNNMSLRDELRQMKPFELMGKIYGSMAHELTALLSNEFLLSQLESNLEVGNCPEALKKVGFLQLQSKRASDILHTFRTMARGQHEPIVEFNLGDSLYYIVNVFREIAKRSGVQLYYENKTTSSCVVRMQKTGIELIMHNLFLNAVQQIERLQFLRSGPWEILVQFQDETDSHGTRWGIVRVYDNGPGIHKRDFQRVFDIHYTTKEQGCGMGLDISRNIARRAKQGGRTGDVLVSRSILLIGTTFEVRLPLQ